MNKKLLKETYDIRVGRYKKQDGSYTKVIYIDPTTSQDTYPYKDEIRNKFGAVWSKNLKTWCWFCSDGQQERVVQTKVKPCVEFLTNVEQNDNGERRKVENIIDSIIDQLSNAENLPDVAQNSTVDIKNKLEGFKQELVQCMSDEDFKKKLEPIIKFQRAQGHQYSFMNSLLIMIQCPSATMVKSKTNWLKVNRNVLQNAKGILLKKPSGQREKLSPKHKQAIIDRFVQRCGVNDVKDLSPGEKEELNIKLQGRFMPDHTFSWYLGFDVQDTSQMEGKEDLVGNRNVDVPWYDDSGKETQQTAMYCDALINLIKEVGVSVDAVQSLGGARGVSKSGKIEVLSDTAKNVGLFNTLAHEFSHELLHQRFLHNHNPELKNYFIGTSQGRGKVEQQAELSAWIVLRNYGFDVPTNINYVGLWGLDDRQAPFVFDTVSSVASYIVSGIDKQLNNINESKRNKCMIREGKFLPSGEELATIVGCGEVYRRGKAQIEEDRIIREEVKKLLKNYLSV